MDTPSIRCTEQATLDPFAHVLLMMADRFQIKKTALAGVAFFREDHPYADQLRLVAEHVDKAGMRNGDEVLVGAPAQVDFLLPVLILADDKRSDALFHEQINESAAVRVQVDEDISPIFFLVL